MSEKEKELAQETAAPMFGGGKPVDPKAWRVAPEPVLESDISETVEADIIVVGAGHAGVAVTRAAAEGGAHVICIEQMMEERYWAYGIDFGHINSQFLRSRGVPEVDELEFFNDWQLRSNNRSDPRLVMQFTRNCGSCFDWFLQALTPEQVNNVDVRFWPGPKYFKGELNGIKTWIGTATFPEALWDNKGITNAVVANMEKAKREGAVFHFGVSAKQLEKTDGRVTAVIASSGGKNIRYVGKKAVVLAAGDFSGNASMMADLCDELVTLADGRGNGWPRGGGRTGRGIQMGYWAGGRIVPGPIATMGGNTKMPNSPLGVAATLWLGPDNRRYCNEGFADGVYSGIEGARLGKKGTLVNLFCGDTDELLQHQAPVHSALWINNPDDPLVRQYRQYIDGARTAGAEGFAAPDPRPGAPKNGPAQPKLYCADSLQQLADYLGFEGEMKQNMLDSVARYNELCYQGRDEDFGKDPSLMIPVDKAPYYGMLTDIASPSMGAMVTVDGLWTDEYQNVLDNDLEPIAGLYATGNCCGRRFGVQYSTPVSGVSIGICWTLGRELGKYLVGK